MEIRLKFSVIFLGVVVAFVVILPSSIWGDDEKFNDTQELYEHGQKVFQEKGCMSCHTIGQGRLVGPDLKDVTERRNEEWLKKWLKNPDAMVYTDPIAKELLKEYLVPMPNQGLTDKDIDALIDYLNQMDNQHESE